MKVINFFGAPGAGKSTAALGLAYQMKRCWLRAELVTEVAKDYVWRDSTHMLAHQNLIMAQQDERLSILDGKADVVVSDSPLLLSALYAPREFPASFYPFVFEMFERFDNINFLIDRSHEYTAIGRVQSESESDVVAQILPYFLSDNGVPFYRLPASDATPVRLLMWLHQHGHVRIRQDILETVLLPQVPEIPWAEPQLILPPEDVRTDETMSRRRLPESVPTT